MIWTPHYELRDKHAFLGASKNTWLRKSDSELIESFRNEQAKALGTRLHALAAEHIDLGIKMPRTSDTLSHYINDAIGYRMSPEVILKYSDLCFGTTDAIAFRNNRLRIHDLKTGSTPAHIDQLMIYAALFCLEYGIDPMELASIDLSIYQSNDILSKQPSGEDISDIMNAITHKDEVLHEYINGEK